MITRQTFKSGLFFIVIAIIGLISLVACNNDDVPTTRVSVAEKSTGAITISGGGDTSPLSTPFPLDTPVEPGPTQPVTNSTQPNNDGTPNCNTNGQLGVNTGIYSCVIAAVEEQQRLILTAMLYSDNQGNFLSNKLEIALIREIWASAPGAPNSPPNWIFQEVLDTAKFQEEGQIVEFNLDGSNTVTLTASSGNNVSYTFKTTQ